MGIQYSYDNSVNVCISGNYCDIYTRQLIVYNYSDNIDMGIRGSCSDSINVGIQGSYIGNINVGT